MIEFLKRLFSKKKKVEKKTVVQIRPSSNYQKRSSVTGISDSSSDTFIFDEKPNMFIDKGESFESKVKNFEGFGGGAMGGGGAGGSFADDEPKSSLNWDGWSGSSSDSYDSSGDSVGDGGD